MEEVFVIGHLVPDTDTTVSAVSMAEFLNARQKKENNNKFIYKPAMTGKPNTETEYVFKKFNYNLPILLEDATGKKLFLVDHNESSQIVKGFSNENILGFVDHHKIKFECSQPIEIITKPWGSTNTIIYYLFEKENLEIPEKIKPLMLSAILSDTVITKSPTTTEKDLYVIKKLSSDLNVDYKELGLEIFKAKAQISKKTTDEIIKNDFKDFDFNGKKFGIGQIELPSLDEIKPKYSDLIKKTNELKQKENYHTILLMITDIIKEGSVFLVLSEEEKKIADIFKTKIDNNLTEFLPGILSRKKQVASKLAENF
ncbi:MAG: manganese-dependent inorganic pyrophosphatase [Candidatus Woesearchaeota archaeon]